MLNRNAFIDDVINLLQEKQIITEKDLPNIRKFIAVDKNVIKWNESFSVTEFFLRRLYYLSSAERNVLSITEIETLLKKHAFIVSHVCPANFMDLDIFCQSKTPNFELEDKDSIGTNYMDMLPIEGDNIRDLVSGLKSIGAFNVELHFANHLYQRYLRQPDFDLYKVALELYQTIPQNDIAFPHAQKRIAELALGYLQANVNGKLKNELTEAERDDYSKLAIHALVRSGSVRASLYMVDELLRVADELAKANHVGVQTRNGYKNRFFERVTKLQTVDADISRSYTR